MISRAIFAGLMALAIAAPAAAAPKAKMKAPGAVEVFNKRAVSLNAFVLTNEAGKTVGKLAKPVAAGKKASVKIAAGKGCAYLARWEFEDAGDEAQVNLCNDPKIVLTD